MAVSYGAVSLVILGPVITSGFLHHSVLIEGDASFPVWANGWAAFALTHFRDPFFSPDVWAPHGVNLLANTDAAGLAVIFAPVTWVIGPIGAFNLQLALLPVVSGLAMCVAVRPWVQSSVAVWIAGLAWGFCPVALEALSWGWTNFLYLATAPLVFWVLADLLHFRRRSSRFLGIVVSVVVTVQFTIGTEMLAMLAITTALTLVVLTIAALLRNRSMVKELLPRVGLAVAWSLPILLVVLVPLVIFTLKGPAPLPNWVFPPVFFRTANMALSSLVENPTAAGAFLAHFYYGYPSHFYFSYVLLAAAVAVVAWRWREPLTWALVIAGVLSCWLAMGSRAFLRPWHLLLQLPVVHNLVATRFIEVMWFPVIFLVALGLDRAVTRLSSTFSSRRALAMGLVFPVIAFSQLGYGLAQAVNIHAWSISPDPAIVAVARTTPDSLLVTFPFPLSARGMIQETADGFAYRLAGGWGPEQYVGSATNQSINVYFAELTDDGGPQMTAAELNAAGAEFHEWHVTAAISPWSLPYPTDRGYAAPGTMVATMVELYGLPTAVDGDWVWYIGNKTWHDKPLSRHRWNRCIIYVQSVHPRSVASCIERALQGLPT
jgi:hypothetical protein